MTLNEVDLGACCACGLNKPDVRNMICLDRPARVSGTGWGCAVCGLPADGAVAVVCDDCLVAGREIRFVVYGYADRKQRMAVADLPAGDFNHDVRFHALDHLQGGGVQ